MTRYIGAGALWLVVGFILITGCAGPDINDLAKQEFVVREKPVIHLALRGLRQERKLICQVFLLTESESMWISGADLKLSDGSLHDPKSLASLDDDERDRYYDRDFYYGTGYGWSYGYPRYPYYRRYWRYGMYGGYRTAGGVCIPPWYLLDRPAESKTPHGLEFTYELPEGQATCDGCELVIHVAIGSEDGDKGKKGDKKKDAEAAAEAEKRLRVSFVFALSEKLPAETKGAGEQKPGEIVREIRFSRQEVRAPE